MDELAKRLSIISFGVIGVICLIGVIQHRSWLEMFTIGGAFPDSHPEPAAASVLTISPSSQCRSRSQPFRRDFRSS